MLALNQLTDFHTVDMIDVKHTVDISAMVMSRLDMNMLLPTDPENTKMKDTRTRVTRLELDTTSKMGPNIR